MKHELVIATITEDRVNVL